MEERTTGQEARPQAGTPGAFPGLGHYDARELLVGSLELPRASFQLFTWLNVVLFGVGIVVLLGGAIFALVRGRWEFTAIYGGLDLAAILAFFFLNPLKRIVNAAADQAQLRAAVFGYWLQLTAVQTELQQARPNADLALVKEANLHTQQIIDHIVDLLHKHVEQKEG